MEQFGARQKLQSANNVLWYYIARDCTLYIEGRGACAAANMLDSRSAYICDFLRRTGKVLIKSDGTCVAWYYDASRLLVAQRNKYDGFGLIAIDQYWTY